MNSKTNSPFDVDVLLDNLHHTYAARTRFPFKEAQSPESGPYLISDVGACIIFACPSCKVGGLRFAHELQYEGGSYTKSNPDGRHALNLDLVHGCLDVDPCLNDPSLLAVLRVPLYCKQCGAECVRVDRIEPSGHFYSTLEASK